MQRVTTTRALVRCAAKMAKEGGDVVDVGHRRALRRQRMLGVA
jgi:hypothetical protein